MNTCSPNSKKKLLLPALFLATAIPSANAAMVLTLDVAQTDGDTFALDARWEGFASEPGTQYAELIHPSHKDWTVFLNAPGYSSNADPTTYEFIFVGFREGPYKGGNGADNYRIYTTDGHVLLDPLEILEEHHYLKTVSMEFTRAADGLGAHVVFEIPAAPETPPRAAVLASLLLGWGWWRRKARRRDS